MKFVNTETKSEVFPDDVSNLPENVKSVDRYHWFFTGYDERTYTIKWDTLELIKRPVPLRWITCSPKEFIELFTIEELRDIYNHANEVVDCRIWLDWVAGSPYIHIEDEAVIVGMLYLVSRGIIREDRYSQIMIPV